MGNFIASNVNLYSSTNIDHKSGTKEEVSLKNGIWTIRKYEKDNNDDWKLVQEETDDIKPLMNTFSLKDGITIGNDGVKIGNLDINDKGVMLGNQRIVIIEDESDKPTVKSSTINVEEVPNNPEHLYTKFQQIKSEHQRIDLLKRYQQQYACVPVEYARKLADTLSTNSNKVQLYETILKCIVKRKL